MGKVPAAEPDGFRSDINGLRAIAIALVVAFHLAPGWAPGGFIGVDVFFVISGYLMTRIIGGRIGQGRFRLGGFYLARLRRIWPALVVLCALPLVAGTFLVDPWAYEGLARDAPAAIGFFSNFVFAGGIMYFAPDQDRLWLLHTWSLSVEWQFYLAYPLALLGIGAVPALKRRMWTILAVLAALSFGLCVVFWSRASQGGFYLLPGRAWELLAGGLCVAIEARVRLGRTARRMLHALGLAMIGAGALLADPSPGWPSPLALLPVGGAALVIVADLGRTAWAGNAVVGLIGRASYSIYLWHWPLIVALRQAGVAFTLPVSLGAVVAMVAAGLASYWLVERRLTDWIFATRRRQWGGLAVAGLVAALALAAAQTRGFEVPRTAGLSPGVRAALADDRLAARDWSYPRACDHRAVQGPLQLCQMGDPAARQVVVVGDSHAEQFAPRYAHAFDGRAGEGLTYVTHDACLPVPGLAGQRPGGDCARWTAAAYAWVERAGFRRVVIQSSWTIYVDAGPGPARLRACPGGGRDCVSSLLAGSRPLADAAFQRLADEVARLQRLGAEVVLAGPTPRGPAADPQALYDRAFWSGAVDAPPILRSDYAAQAGYVLDRLRRVSAQTGAAFVDMLDGMCPQGLCPVTASGRALYRDSGHLRASTVAGPRFAYLDAWLAPPVAAPTPIRLK